MKKQPLSSGFAKLKQAEPLPALIFGYLWGVLFSFIHSLATDFTPSWSLHPTPIWNAFLASAATEIPFWALCTLLGFCQFPRLSLLPILFRSFLWGYGSFQVYLAAGKSTLYFLYVWGCALTLLPLACLTKLSMFHSASPKRLTGSDHLRYLYQCLYFWGLTIIILLFRGTANHFLC